MSGPLSLLCIYLCTNVAMCYAMLHYCTAPLQSTISNDWPQSAIGQNQQLNTEHTANINMLAHLSFYQLKLNFNLVKLSRKASNQQYCNISLSCLLMQFIICWQNSFRIIYCICRAEASVSADTCRTRHIRSQSAIESKLHYSVHRRLPIR